jgi:hypothetical protein
MDSGRGRLVGASQLERTDRTGTISIGSPSASPFTVDISVVDDGVPRLGGSVTFSWLVDEPAPTTTTTTVSAGQTTTTTITTAPPPPEPEAAVAAVATALRPTQGLAHAPVLEIPAETTNTVSLRPLRDGSTIGHEPLQLPAGQCLQSNRRQRGRRLLNDCSLSQSPRRPQRPGRPSISR